MPDDLDRQPDQESSPQPHHHDCGNLFGCGEEKGTGVFREDIKDAADHVLYIPAAPEELLPILEIVPLQLLAYHIAVRRGCDVDQPRNLAKSVTVE